MMESENLGARKLRPDKKFKPPLRDEGDEFFPNGIFEFNVTKLLAFIGANPDSFPVEQVEVEPLASHAPERLAEVYTIIWQFKPKPELREEFEAAYASDGPWAALFGRGEGYLGTQLVLNEDEEVSYLTFDKWRSKANFDNFKVKWKAEYEALDKKLEHLTASETRIGAFNAVGPAEVAGSGMLSHVSLGVRDLKRSEAFYDGVLAPLGYAQVWKNEHGIGYGLPGNDDKLALFEEALADRSLAAGAGFHLAFDAPNPDAVTRFYAAALALGGQCDGKPGLRPQYSKTYFAAVVFDPDGHRLEAVHQ